MSLTKLTKLAEKFKIKLAQRHIMDVRRIRDQAFDLARHMDILEKAALDGSDIYHSIDNPQEAQKRVLRTKRLLNGIRAIGMQMYRDAAGPGMSKQTASFYVNRLKQILSWLRNIDGLQNYTELTKPLEQALDSFTPRDIRKRKVDPGSSYIPTPKKRRKPKPSTFVPDPPGFDEMSHGDPVIVYGPEMVGKL